jgi:hypothetical protein
MANAPYVSTSAATPPVPNPANHQRHPHKLLKPGYLSERQINQRGKHRIELLP